MTSNDLEKKKFFYYGFMHIKRKIGTQAIQQKQRIQFLTF